MKWGFKRIHDENSWVAEWYDRLLGVCNVHGLGDKNFFLVSDNVSATLKHVHFRSFRYHVMDFCIRAMMRLDWSGGMMEGYLLAQRDTSWSSMVSDAQKRADCLASVRESAEAPFSIPCNH